MSQELNCWQFKNCGREEGGVLAEVLGVCRVATSMKHDGTNGGRAAGRVCWEVRHSVRQGSPCGRDAACQQCAFYLRVHYEETEPASAAIPEAAAEHDGLLKTSPIDQA